MTNEHGLDVRYFKNELDRLLTNLEYHTPKELARALATLAFISDHETAIITIQAKEIELSSKTYKPDNKSKTVSKT